MKNLVIASIKRSFASLGLELSVLSEFRRSMWGAVTYLKDRGFEPRTIIDVGVAWGTNDLYNRFPNATFVLVEPLLEFKEQIEAIQKRVQAIFVPAAAGAKSGTKIEMYVKPHTSGSSVFAELDKGGGIGEKREVDVVALDDVVRDQDLQGPFLLKIDAEGGELDVLAGASAVLRESEAVILEVTFIPKLVGAPDFFAVVKRMDELGYAVYDLFNFVVRPHDKALFQADCCFVRQTSGLRASI